jgi:hypothetical protein
LDVGIKREVRNGGISDGAEGAIGGYGV